ncbi:MAG: LytTR family transcriptional regulator DNA-binding domain-containing protein [Treponema sp.]|nr:LytTR family transcriptional regulator DNA-binding domain-containing protein [Treponema sp.]
MKIIINTDEQCAETEITIRCGRLSDDIEKIIAAIRMLDTKLTGNRNGRQHLLETSDVTYIETTDKRTFLYTLTGVYETPFRLYELEAKLADMDFLRASKNCLVNINHIQSIEPDFDRRLVLTMEKGVKLMVSRQYSATVKQKLEAYHG